MTNVAFGAKTNSTFTSLTDGKGFSTVGERFTDQNGKIWVLVKASAAIAQYDVCTIDPTYNTTVAPLSTSNGSRGNLIGVAAVAFASGDYGWLQIYGPCTMNVLASCVANVRLNTTATAGSPDDDGTASAKVVDGLYLTTTRGSTAGSAPGIVNSPAVGATL